MATFLDDPSGMFISEGLGIAPRAATPLASDIRSRIADVGSIGVPSDAELAAASPTLAQPSRQVPAGSGARRASSRLVPTFKENPIAALGHIISNAAAGLRGDQLPSERLAIAQQEADAREFNQAMKLLEVGAAAPALRKGIVNAFGERFPEIEEIFSGLDSGDNEITELVDSMTSLSPGAKKIAMSLAKQANGSTAEFMKMIGDPKVKEFLTEVTASEFDDVVRGRMRGLGELVGEDVLTQWEEALGDGRMTRAELEGVQEASGGTLFPDQAMFNYVRNNMDRFADLGFVSTREAGKLREKELERAEQIDVKTIEDSKGNKFLTGVRRSDGKQVWRIASGKAGIGSGKTPQSRMARHKDTGETRQAIFDPGSGTNRFVTGSDAGKIVSDEWDVFTPSATGAIGDVTEQREAAKERIKVDKDIRESLREHAQKTTRISLLLDGVRSGKFAVGIPGVALRAFQGYLRQIPGAGPVVDAVSTYIQNGNFSRGAAAEFMSRATQLVGENISTFSGEGSKRFSEPERKLTLDALRLLSAGASQDEVAAVLQDLLVQHIANVDNGLFAKNRAPFDHTLDANGNFIDQEGVGKFVETMMRLGLDKEQRTKAFKLIVDQRTVLTDMGFFERGLGKK